jgi:hypothetical protein
VAHDAGFDIAFLNAELTRAAKPLIATERVVDTLMLARRNHPGAHNTLDELFALWHKFTAQQTWRFARRRVVGRRLRRTDHNAASGVGAGADRADAIKGAGARQSEATSVVACDCGLFFLSSRAAGGAELTASQRHRPASP